MPATTSREDNLTNQRFVVDPVLRNEPADVREQKLAFRADLRIINGVWYVPDPSAPHLPGLPIWSDCYDFHLDMPDKQPPGAPLYNVQGIFLWQAE